MGTCHLEFLYTERFCGPKGVQRLYNWKLFLVSDSLEVGIGRGFGAVKGYPLLYQLLCSGEVCSCYYNSAVYPPSDVVALFRGPVGSLPTKDVFLVR